MAILVFSREETLQIGFDLDSAEEEEHQPAGRHNKVQVSTHLQERSDRWVQVEVHRSQPQHSVRQGRNQQKQVHDARGQETIPSHKGEAVPMAKGARPGEGAHEQSLEQNGEGASSDLGHKRRPAQGGRKGHDRAVEDEAAGGVHHGGAQGHIV